jgi:hypothetical protein
MLVGDDVIPMNESLAAHDFKLSADQGHDITESHEKHLNALLLDHSLPVSVELDAALMKLRSWPAVDATLRERALEPWHDAFTIEFTSLLPMTAFNVVRHRQGWQGVC